VFRTSSSETLKKCSKIGNRKCTYSYTRLLNRLANTHEKAPQRALPFTYTVGQPHDAAGRQRRPKYDRSRQWAACPIGSRNPTTCGRLSASSTRRPRRSVSREDNLLLFDAGRDRVSRRAASRNSSYQRETQGRPRRFASTPPRARTGHPILATCEARDRAPRVPTGQASVSGRIRRRRLRAGARVPRAG